MSAPVLVLTAWLLAELTAAWLRRRAAGGRAAIWGRVAAWSFRPWAVWAVFNAFCRVAWAWGFNDPHTFPFYAGAWQPDAWAGTAVLRLAGRPEVWVAGAIASVAATGLAALAARAVAASEDEGRWVRMAAVLPVLTLFFWLAVAVLPLRPDPAQREPGSLLRPWYNPGSTLLYAMPLVRSSAAFLRDYREIQPRLKPTIHGLSHPPGAPLSLKVIGRIMGAGFDIRHAAVKLRYLAGLAAAGALNALVLVALGAALTGSRRVGIVTAALWAVCPAAVAYATFAHDIFYALFFNLCLWLIYRTQTAERMRLLELAALGAGLFVLAMLTYSAVLAVAILGVFGLLAARAGPAPLARCTVRVGLPLAFAGLGLVGLRLVYGFDYLAAYRVARAYVEQWYRFDGMYQWGLALLGGQLELLLMMGGATALAFLAAVRRGWSGRPLSHDRLFLLVILGIYLIPILLGPNPLKMETSRCWHWVTSVPLVWAARWLTEQPRAAVWSAAAVASAAATSLILRMFLDFSL
jgi:hypothetical protein